MVANKGATNMKNIEIVRWIVSSQSAKLQQFLQKDYKVSKAQTRGNKKKRKLSKALEYVTNDLVKLGENFQASLKYQ